MNIAVTGTLGSGKSSVSRILANTLAAVYVDTDQICRLEMLPGEKGYKGFIESFGGQYLDPRGDIDRLALREAVFGTEGVRERLEAILHPLVRQRVEQVMATAGSQGTPLVVEVPLLFEVGWQSDFDICVTVYVDRKLAEERVGRRDGLALPLIRLVQDTQMHAEEKNLMADYIINNCGTLTSSVLQVRWLVRELLSGNETEKRGGMA